MEVAALLRNALEPHDVKHLLIAFSAALVVVGVCIALTEPGLFDRPATGVSMDPSPALAKASVFMPPERFPEMDPAELGMEPANQPEIATFGAGCFWCSEAVFRRVRGVRSVVSGYSGGRVTNPTHEEVGRGTTGHAEVVQVTFDRKQISYAQLLEVFWRSHDPTTPNRQWFDEGPQYRSVIFVHSNWQRVLAERYKRKIDAADVYPDPLVTEIVTFEAFYPASKDDQDYYTKNAQQPYCKTRIGLKLDKLKAVFGDRFVTPGE